MKKTYRLLFMLLALSVVMLSCTAENDKQYPRAADFILPNLEHKMIGLSDFKGQVILLNFWATWCPPCREEIPDFVQLQEKYGPSGLNIIGVSLDTSDMGRVRQFAAQYKVNYIVLYAGEQKKKIVRDYGNFRGIPTSFLINRQGQTVRQVTGVVQRNFWEREIKALL
ncbi:MAG: TlpA family protein disulfide reductase [Deltaproteobacteria bacterium]|nr:TlpA family protein disulfide reductase [Deltaproteobacteria bacterium]MBW2085048.1 TlpA family protein disulfide reductase [Deltaproteobacteria bacterium]